MRRVVWLVLVGAVGLGLSWPARVPISSAAGSAQQSALGTSLGRLDMVANRCVDGAMVAAYLDVPKFKGGRISASTLAYYSRINIQLCLSAERLAPRYAPRGSARVRDAYQRVLRGWLPALGVAKNIDGVTLRMAHGANNGSALPTLLRYLRADQRAAVRIEGSVRRQFGIGS